ncbi:MAG: non-ribosomal peptide synthetase, partial [Anaerolineales bacterium]|nr:non-ribosomal peptide synthetase [Anaerolineales bacterium]
MSAAMVSSGSDGVNRQAQQPASGPATLVETASVDPPRPAVEQAVTKIWQEVLEETALSADVGFFDLGGDSITATEIVARVRETFAVELSLKELLAEPTIAGMADRIVAALQARRLSQLPPVTQADRSRPLPLSYAQERMWFLHALAPGNSAYHIVTLVRLRGPFDLAAAQTSLEALLRRHESLRTTFPAVDGRPVQVIAPPAPFPMPVVDLQPLPAAERLPRAIALAQAETERPYDLERGPLLRVSLYRLEVQEHLLLLAMHHIISDAWSLGVLAREVMALYTAAREGLSQPLPEPTLQYVDFAVWQRAWLQGPVLEQSLAHWRQKLAGLAVLDLPPDRPRPAVQTYDGAVCAAELEPALLADLRQLSQQAEATLSMTLLAAFQVLLHHYTGQTDIAVGLPIANRQWLAVEPMIGAFVNTLVLRTDLSGNPTFRELLARVRQASLDAYAHQDMPFARLVAELKPDRSLSHPPLVQVMFNLV